jgi:hypothetical protein
MKKVVKEGMKCKKCGVQNADDAPLCSGCGGKLETGVVVIKEGEMKKYFPLELVLQLISQGDVCRKAFTVALRVLAVMIAVAGFVSWISAWKFASNAHFAAIVGIIIFQLFFVIALYMVIHTLFIRSRDIAELPETEFHIIPIASIFLKLMGEIYACFVTAISIAGGILIWFMRGQAFYLLKKTAPLPLVPGLGGGEGFLGGLLFITAGLFMAFFVLAFFYFLAELVVVMADTAKNIKITRHIAEQYDKK